MGEWHDGKEGTGGRAVSSRLPAFVENCDGQLGRYQVQPQAAAGPVHYFLPVEYLDSTGLKVLGGRVRNARQAVEAHEIEVLAVRAVSNLRQHLPD